MKYSWSNIPLSRSKHAIHRIAGWEIPTQGGSVSPHSVIRKRDNHDALGSCYSCSNTRFAIKYENIWPRGILHSRNFSFKGGFILRLLGVSLLYQTSLIAAYSRCFQEPRKFTSFIQWKEGTVSVTDNNFSKQFINLCVDWYWDGFVRTSASLWTVKGASSSNLFRSDINSSHLTSKLCSAGPRNPFSAK